MSMQKVVLAFDGSDGSKKALEWTIPFIKQNGGELHIVSVFEPLVTMAIEAAGTLLEIDEARRASLDKLEVLSDTLTAEHGIHVKTVVLEGYPADVLIHYANKQKAAMLICGTRGYGGFGALLLGSVAHKLVTYATIPVLVVK